MLGYTLSMKQITALLTGVLLVAFLLIQGTAVQADSDHDDARRLRDSGDILSLELILEKLRESHPGKILEVELETESGHLVYEIEMLSDDGIVRELIIDAKTGELLRSKRDD